MEDMLKQVKQGLSQPENCKEIPFSLLYDDIGSSLYEDITRLSEYYPFNAEIALFQSHAEAIVASIPSHSVIVELGCGTGTKTSCLLNAFIKLHSKSCLYVGIDVSAASLKEVKPNLLHLVKALQSENIVLVEAEYFEGLKKTREAFPNQHLTILWIGNSVGNYTRPAAIAFFKKMLEIVGTNCQVLLCTDMWSVKEMPKLYSAYHDEKGVTELFIKNGLRNACTKLGFVPSEEEQTSWEYVVQINKEERQVEMFVAMADNKPLNIPKHHIYVRGGEKILVEVSRKFTSDGVYELASSSWYSVEESWTRKGYGCHLLLPALTALRSCWKDTDTLMQSIPDWDAKPIDLRHPFGFYYAHVNAFTKLKLMEPAAPSKLDILYSRGIDPSVLDPSVCHTHPQVPTSWPARPAILSYVVATREEVMKWLLSRGLLDRSPTTTTTTTTTTTLAMVIEHERMHHETLAYMLAQQRRSEFEAQNRHLEVSHTDCDGVRLALKKALAAAAAAVIPSGSPVAIPGGHVTLGCDVANGVFRWDNEQPSLGDVAVGPFAVSSSPVTVGEYLAFVLGGGYDVEDLWDPQDFAFFKKEDYKWPATWSIMEGLCAIHAPFSTRLLSEVSNMPVYVSLSEAQAYCKWKGGRIMTEAEYQQIIDMCDEETLDGEVLHMRDEGWEWTNSPFQPFPGFHPSPLYKEYSTDFFDSKHFVLKGSSPVTHPSLKRDSFRNFYQREYRFVFAKFRCCFDTLT